MLPEELGLPKLGLILPEGLPPKLELPPLGVRPFDMLVAGTAPVGAVLLPIIIWSESGS